MSDLTICAMCSHCIKGDMWYNTFCSEYPRAKAIDLVTGESGYTSKNDLGTTSVSGQQYNFCRDINQGNCEKFSPLS